MNNERAYWRRLRSAARTHISWSASVQTMCAPVLADTVPNVGVVTRPARGSQTHSQGSRFTGFLRVLGVSAV